MNLESLESLKKKYLAEVEFRRKGDTSGVDYKYNIMVCGGTGCRSCKSKKVQEKLEEVIKAHNLEKEIMVNGVGCFGLCVNGPIVLVYPQDAMYEKVSVDDCRSGDYLSACFNNQHRLTVSEYSHNIFAFNSDNFFC